MVGFRKILAMAMVGIGIFTLVGCNSKTTPNSSATSSATSSQSLQNSTTTSNSHNVPGSAASTSGEESTSSGNTITAQEKQTAFEAMRDNFSLTFLKDGGEPLTVSRFGNNTYAKSPSEEYYTSTEGDKTFTYKLESDEKWHKNESAPSDLSAAEAEKLFDQIDPTSCDYDSNTNVFSGSLQGGTFELCPGTEFTLPDFVDDTELVYENGKFNFVLLKQVLENWILSENRYNGDIITEILGVNNKFDRILFINPSLDNIEFTFFCKNEEKIFLRNASISTITGATIYEGLKNGTIKSYSQLSDALRDFYKKTCSLGSMKVEIDQTIPKEDFDKMTQNIFNRLQTVGYQGSSVNNPGTVIDLKNAEIICRFASTKSEERAGLDLGYEKDWNHYYVIEKDGQLEFLNIGVAASTNIYNDNHMVVENVEGGWFVTSYQETDLDNQNLEILESAENSRTDDKS